MHFAYRTSLRVSFINQTFHCWVPHPCLVPIQVPRIPLDTIIIEACFKLFKVLRHIACQLSSGHLDMVKFESWWVIGF